MESSFSILDDLVNLVIHSFYSDNTIVIIRPLLIEHRA